jgi:hypothetical protein
LRVLVAGELDVVAPERPGDHVLAFLFLTTIDRVIDMVPLLGDWVLGDDENLVTLYVRVQGPWDDPSASLVAPNTVRNAAGWAGRMIELGVERIRNLLPGADPDPPSKETRELSSQG